MTELLSASDAKKLATTPKQSAWLIMAMETISRYAKKGDLYCLVPKNEHGPDPSDLLVLEGLGYSVVHTRQFHGYAISWEYA